jgi:hypothetical protein
MAFTASALHLRGGAAGSLTYLYSTASDAMATVAAAGYFNNTTYNSNFVAGDLIFCMCSDGNTWQRVSSVSSGSVTMQYAGGDLPILTPGSGTDATLGSGFSISGYAEVGAIVSTASRYVLFTPYKGAAVEVFYKGSASGAIEIHAGGSGATGITFDGTNRRILLSHEGDGFRARGISTTRWVIERHSHNASAVSEDASVWLVGS